MVQVLNKTLTKELEKTTVDVQSLIFSNKINHIERMKCSKIFMNILLWYTYHNDIDVNDSIYKKWMKLTNLLGFHKPYIVQHSYRSALWAFKWDGEYALIYYDKTGFTLQVNRFFPLHKLQNLLENIESKLCNKS